MAAHLIETPLGPMMALEANNKLVALDLFDGDIGAARHTFSQPTPLIRELERQLDAYFAGRLKQFDLPIDMAAGTPFQQAVWRTLLEVPYGATTTYAAQAQKIGRPKAMRAVGNANAKNPLMIIVPCHRAILSNGGLGGYAGGVARKRALLELESR